MQPALSSFCYFFLKEKATKKNFSDALRAYSDDGWFLFNRLLVRAVRTVGDGATVTDQTPAGGAIVPTGAEIILYMGAEKSDALCKVPNVIGLSAADANRKLTDAGLIMKAAGASGSGVKAISQSTGQGAEVPAGTPPPSPGPWG